MSPPPLPRRPPRPRRLTMAPTPSPLGTPASKRRLEFLSAATQPPSSERRAGLAGVATEEPLLEVIGGNRSLFCGDHGGGTAARWDDAGGSSPGGTPSKRRLDSPVATTTKSKRRLGSPAATTPKSKRRLESSAATTPKSLVRGETGTRGSCRRGTPSKRRLADSPHCIASTPRSKRRRAHAGAGGITERPVEVIGRIRNLAADGGASALEVQSGGTTVRVRGDAGGRGSCTRDFILDGVSLADKEGLEGLYRRFLRSRVEGVREGAKCTVIVYGPTGSGKSHTMFGSDEQPGVVYLALRDILERSGAEDDAGKSVQVSVLEIYNEEVFDLLAANTPNPMTKVKLEVMGTKARNATFIHGNEAGKISSEVAEVEKRRALNGTHYDTRSSRSHCMIILDVPSVGGRLMLVDMAGSENIEAAGQTGHEAKSETGSINQGNTTLRRVVESIADGDPHVPFRDSKLTRLLQDSFDDERCKILMIMCASPDPKELHKTISTLEYGARAKCITRVACAPTPRDKMSSKEAEIRLKDEEIARLRKKLSLKEEREAEIGEKLAAKEEEIIAIAEEARMMEEIMEELFSA